MRKRKDTVGTVFRSGFELDFSRYLEKCSISFTFEKDKFDYVVTHKYTPDFKVGDNVYIETKGRFLGKDRTKHLHIKKQHPQLKVILVFMDPSMKLTKKSKTSYSDWCNKNGIPWVRMGDMDGLLKIIA